MAVLWRGQKRWVLPLTLVCFVLGALLAVQVRTQRMRGSAEMGRQSGALGWLVQELTDVQSQLEEQKGETERLRALVVKYEEQAASEKGMIRLMTEELRNSRVALGLLPVEGPGIELALDDSTMRAGTDLANQDLFIIHDFNLLQVANELWAAGAEAISLNGQRLVAGTAVTCSGRLIKVDDVAISTPYVILAIGPRENLISALNIRGGLLDQLRALEFQVKLTPNDRIVIPPVAIAPKYEFAQPVTEEVEQ